MLPAATRPQNTRRPTSVAVVAAVPAGAHLPGVSAAGTVPPTGMAASWTECGSEFFHPLHGESKRGIGRAIGSGQRLQNFQQRGASVAAPASGGAGLFGCGIDHVPAQQGRHGHGGHGMDACGLRKGREGCLNVGKRQHGVGHGIELVHGKHDAGHAQQLHQQRVAARLREQRQRGVGPVELGGIDQHHGGIGTAGGRDHVAGVLLVAGGVANDELARLGAEVAVGHVDGDALLALGAQAIGQQGQVGFTLALHARQVVLQHGLAVHQQAADQRAFAVVHAAAGDEAQGVGSVCRRL
jgi:hypothetical protein